MKDEVAVRLQSGVKSFVLSFVRDWPELNNTNQRVAIVYKFPQALFHIFLLHNNISLQPQKFTWKKDKI